jgi:thymidine kinase
MLSLIIGPMFSGKTTELVRRLNRYQIAGKKVILFRPTTDTRDHLTHDRLSHDIQEVFTGRLYYTDWQKYDVIGIDEGQFFTMLKDDADYFADQGKTVIISALNGTSEKKQFDQVQGLIPFAEEIVKLNAVCMDCGSDYGTFTYYKAGNKTKDVQVGDEHEYMALCRKCYQGRVHG